MNKLSENQQSDVVENDDQQAGIIEGANQLFTLFNRYEREFGSAISLGRAMAGMLTNFLMSAEIVDQAEQSSPASASTAGTSAAGASVASESLDQPFDDSFWDKSASYENSKLRADEILKRSVELVSKMDRIAAGLGLKVLVDIKKQIAYGPGKNINISGGDINLEVADPEKFAAAMDELHQNKKGKEISAILDKVHSTIRLQGNSVNLSNVEGLGHLHDLAEVYLPGTGRVAAVFNRLNQSYLPNDSKRKIVCKAMEGESIANKLGVISTGDATMEYLEKALGSLENFAKDLSTNFADSEIMQNYLSELKLYAGSCLTSYVTKLETWQAQGSATSNNFKKAIVMAKRYLRKIIN